MMMRMILAVVLAGLAGVAAAQVPDAADAVDPARLALAHTVVDLAYPPATRATMFAGASAAMSPMVERAMFQNPDMQKAFADDPRVRPIIDRYLATMRAKTAAMIDAAIPSLFAAYDRAYARRFTLAQLGDLKAFFATPTGQVYTARSLSLLSDPDVVAANQAMISGAMKDVRANSQAMAAELKALPPLKPKSQP